MRPPEAALVAAQEYPLTCVISPDIASQTFVPSRLNIVIRGVVRLAPVRKLETLTQNSTLMFVLPGLTLPPSFTIWVVALKLCAYAICPVLIRVGAVPAVMFFAFLLESL